MLCLSHYPLSGDYTSDGHKLSCTNKFVPTTFVFVGTDLSVLFLARINSCLQCLYTVSTEPGRSAPLVLQSISCLQRLILRLAQDGPFNRPVLSYVEVLSMNGLGSNSTPHPRRPNDQMIKLSNDQITNHEHGRTARSNSFPILTLSATPPLSKPTNHAKLVLPAKVV